MIPRFLAVFVLVFAMASRSSSFNKTTVPTEQSAIFTCQTQQEGVFRSLKSMIITAPVLYDLKEETIIKCDASERTALLQKGQSVPFISHSLTSVEQNYAQRVKGVPFHCVRMQTF